MIKRLDELTIAQFIDIVAGDTSALSTEPDVSPAQLAEIMRDIILEYKSIADPAGVKMYLAEHEQHIKARIAVQLFNICSNLLKLHQYDSVREIMSQADYNTSGQSEKWLAAKVASELERAKFNLSKIEDEANAGTVHGAIDVRRDFDEQTAAMMAYFKFQIDTSTMKANIYAHLVARHNREIKAQLKAMKTMGR